MTEECTHEDQWFDRTICADPCGMMHTICNDCGLLDYCPHEDPAGPVPSNDLSAMRDMRRAMCLGKFPTVGSFRGEFPGFCEALDAPETTPRPYAGSVKHGYLSTACWHEDHDSCRRSCEFCHEACRCRCHGRALDMGWLSIEGAS